MAYITDFAVPPKAKVTGGYPFAIVETTESPDAALAWFRKGLTSRGWTSGQQNDGGVSKAVVFKKGTRTLQPVVLPQGGGNAGSRIQIMHMVNPA